LKLLKENIGKTLEDIGRGNSFLNRAPVAQEIRMKTDKWMFIKIKIFFTSRETITRIKRQLTEW
jgi:hypothetical protein